MVPTKDFAAPSAFFQESASLGDLCALYACPVYPEPRRRERSRGVSALDFSSSDLFPTLHLPLATRHSPLQLCFPLTSLEATLTKCPASVHSKRLTPRLSPLKCALPKNRGWVLRYVLTTFLHCVPYALLSRRGPVGVPLHSHGKFVLSLFSSYRYRALPLTTSGGTPIPLAPMSFSRDSPQGYLRLAGRPGLEPG